MKVGTKELKNRLSEYLGQVKRGEIVYVTDRGVIVAEIRAAAATASDEQNAIRDLAAEGAVTRGRGRLSNFSPARLPRGTRASRFIIEDRR